MPLCGARTMSVSPEAGRQSEELFVIAARDCATATTLCRRKKAL
jgi:hypothetical protein